MSRSHPPGPIKRLKADEVFRFLCHENLPCFTHCCRELELAVTPYDVLRLRRGTGLSSSELLDKYLIREQSPEEPFPRFYLTMVDDGRASCVFVAPTGCTIYQHRPGACRTYPIGRGAIRSKQGVEEVFVLLREPHCQGFAETTTYDPQSYSASQKLEPYNEFNDLTATILQHEKIKQGFHPSAEQIDAFVLALYDIDTFRKRLQTGDLPGPVEIGNQALEDDEALLRCALQWVKHQLFNDA